MNLTPREKDKLMIAMAAMVARRRLERGVKLNHPEAVALISDFILEGARDGRTVSANTSRSPRRTRQRSLNAPCVTASPIAERPNTTASAISSAASSASSTSIRRSSRARSNMMVSCGSQLRRAPLAIESRAAISAAGPSER